MIKLSQRFSLIWLILFVSENWAREAIRPSPDVGQIIDELHGLHLNDSHIPFVRGGPCKLDIQKDLPSADHLQPLYLRNNTDRYWLPNADGQLVVDHGASIELYCSKSFAKIDAANNVGYIPGKRLSMHVRCHHGNIFEWSGGRAPFHNFVCKQALEYRVERLEHQRCGDTEASNGDNETGHMYRVGYKISDDRFIRTIELCHNAQLLRTHYARYEMEPANWHFQKQVNRLKFSPAGHFAGYDMGKLYSQSHQESLMGPDMLDGRAGLFLARGHLAAKADLIYASQQRSSFNYVNAAPQWQSFNGGHWANVEDETRRFVARLGIPVSVYTGTFSELPWPGVGHNHSSLHLAHDANNNPVLVVPLLYYRLLIDNASNGQKRGIAIVGVNNPYVTLNQIHDENTSPSYVICEPIDAELVAWLRSLQNSNLRKGYLYACTVADLARAVKHLPRHLLQVHDLLTDTRPEEQKL
ncbi:uncharacterized protein [Drosophila tropicalis]|uniref:uncharacterized protein n=1 Tax=Drosophila tropicalis TaxID=46794 RepID=UPI0035AC10CF